MAAAASPPEASTSFSAVLSRLDCCICLCPLDEEADETGMGGGNDTTTTSSSNISRVCALPCGHLFHSSCISEHLTARRDYSKPAECPLCRTVIPKWTPEEKRLRLEMFRKRHNQMQRAAARGGAGGRGNGGLSPLSPNAAAAAMFDSGIAGGSPITSNAAAAALDDELLSQIIAPAYMHIPNPPIADFIAEARQMLSTATGGGGGGGGRGRGGRGAANNQQPPLDDGVVRALAETLAAARGAELRKEAKAKEEEAYKHELIYKIHVLNFNKKRLLPNAAAPSTTPTTGTASSAATAASSSSAVNQTLAKFASAQTKPPIVVNLSQDDGMGNVTNSKATPLQQQQREVEEVQRERELLHSRYHDALKYLEKSTKMARERRDAEKNLGSRVLELNGSLRAMESNVRDMQATSRIAEGLRVLESGRFDIEYHDLGGQNFLKTSEVVTIFTKRAAYLLDERDRLQKEYEECLLEQEALDSELAAVEGKREALRRQRAEAETDDDDDNDAHNTDGNVNAASDAKKKNAAGPSASILPPAAKKGPRFESSLNLGGGGGALSSLSAVSLLAKRAAGTMLLDGGGGANHHQNGSTVINTAANGGGGGGVSSFAAPNMMMGGAAGAPLVFKPNTSVVSSALHPLHSLTSLHSNNSGGSATLAPQSLAVAGDANATTAGAAVVVAVPSAPSVHHHPNMYRHVDNDNDDATDDQADGIVMASAAVVSAADGLGIAGPSARRGTPQLQLAHPAEPTAMTPPNEPPTQPLVATRASGGGGSVVGSQQQGGDATGGWRETRR